MTKPMTLVRVTISPSFGRPVGYAAERVNQSRIEVVRSASGLPGDASAGVAHASGTRNGAELRAVIDVNEFELVCAPLRAATLCAMPGDASGGLDGTTFAVVIGEWPASSRYEWWMTVPDGWEPLDRFVEAFTRLVDRAVGPRRWY